MTEVILTVYLLAVAILAVFWAVAIDAARQDREVWYREMDKRLDDLGADR